MGPCQVQSLHTLSRQSLSPGKTACRLLRGRRRAGSACTYLRVLLVQRWSLSWWLGQVARGYPGEGSCSTQGKAKASQGKS